jgi:BirA family transcriptional regulator, biotin operon repressor / biotin---[acetyl-CoA-carboxylase] ligase
MVARVQGSFATRAVPGTRFADVRWVAETGSTNRDLLAEASRGTREGVVLVADHQTAGRGRLDRAWTAPPGASLLVSALLRPDLAPTDAFLVTAAAASSARQACREVAGVELGIKWPNDLVVVAGERFAGRKLAGILAESIVTDGHLDAVVVGMGLNVNWPEVLPAELVDTAVSLDHVVGHPVDREALLVSWLRHLDEWLELLPTPEGRDRLRQRQREASATLGRHVRVEQSGRTLTGRALDLSAAGELVVAVDGSEEPLVVSVGDVVHLRHRD